MVHFEAHRINLPSADPRDIPKLSKVLKEGWFHFIPLIILVIFLLQGFSPSRTGLYGIIAIIVVSWFRDDAKMGMKKIVAAMADGAKSAIPVSTACAVAGLVIAGIMSTGLGGKLSSIVFNVTAGHLFLLWLCVLFLEWVCQ